MSYKNLEIWKVSERIVIEVHNMTITKLPRFEMYEEGSQIRRSSKSTKERFRTIRQEIKSFYPVC